jgi:hypothetical protein
MSPHSVASYYKQRDAEDLSKPGSSRVWGQGHSGHSPHGLYLMGKKSYFNNYFNIVFTWSHAIVLVSCLSDHGHSRSFTKDQGHLKYLFFF